MGLEKKFWWLLPTCPVIDTNYFERVWTKKETKTMYKLGKLDTNEAKSDKDGSELKKRINYSWAELIFAVLLIAVLCYCFTYFAVPYMKKNFYEEVEYEKQDSKF